MKQNKSDCCNAEVKFEFDEVMLKPFSECKKCGCACSVHQDEVGTDMGIANKKVVLDDVLSHGQEHLFMFQSNGMVLGLKSIAATPEEAADNLCEMVAGILSEVRMRFPKVAKVERKVRKSK